jgi:DNA polymerase-1
MPNEKKLFLLDAMALIYRAYFALQRSPRITSTGRNTNAQFGFTTTLLDLLNKEKPSHLAVVFEGGKSDTDVHRTAQYAEYKANRQEVPEDIRNSLEDIQRIVEGFSLPCMSSEGYEADDVIGTLALEAAELGYTVYMVTPDKDYGQLVRENVFIYKPGYQGGSFEILGPEQVCAKWNIKRVDQVVDVLGLMGDAVDNIPGIAGVGEKTAAKLLAEYDTLEGVLASADQIKGALGEKVRAGKDMAVLSKQLARIVTDVPVKFHDEDFRVKEVNREKLEAIFNELEFKALGKRVLGEPGVAKAVPLELFPSGGDVTTKTVDTFLTGPPETNISEDEPVGTIATVPHDYKLYQNAEELDELVAALMQQPIFAFDTETDALDANQANLVGMSFSWEKGKGHYVAIPDGREAALEVLQRFQPLFDRTGITWVGQNLKYDLLMLKWYGIEPKGTLWDTMLAHYLIDSDGKRNMDALSLKYLRYEPVSIETLIGKGKDQITMRQAPFDKVAEYAAEDADVTWQLKEAFVPLMDADGKALLEQVESPLVPVLVDMEHAGVGVDVPFLQSYSQDLQREISLAENAVYEVAGLKFNLGSPRQLGEVLFEILKIEGGGKKTKTGQYATGEDVLQKLRNKHPAIESILRYRQLTKLKGTYVDALPQLINARTGRVHTCFNQTIAVTGRLSSINPNLQNIPIKSEAGREIRKAFIAREPGWVLVSADYSQIELRIIAALANEQAMIHAFAEEKDIHTATAAAVFGVTESEVSSEQRRRAKGVNFGLIYGQSAFGLSETLNIPRAEAKSIIDNYFLQYPGIKKFIEGQIGFAREHGYVQTMLGRKRWLRDIRSANQTLRGFAERNSVNMPIQGTAADMIKKAMIVVHDELRRAGMRSRMILQVHDELIFDVPESELEEVTKLIEKSMSLALPLPNGVPVVAQTGYGANWLEAH